MIKPAEELAVGDIVRCRVSAEDPWRRISAVRPYKGPLKEVVFAIAETNHGNGFSLCRGQDWEVQ